MPEFLFGFLCLILDLDSISFPFHFISNHFFPNLIKFNCFLVFVICIVHRRRDFVTCLCMCDPMQSALSTPTLSIASFDLSDWWSIGFVCRFSPWRQFYHSRGVPPEVMHFSSSWNTFYYKKNFRLHIS